jgi:CBS domain-containing protein
MTRDVIALPEEADVADAGRLMLERRIKSIPVLRGRQVVGIVARRDLLEVLARNDEDIARDLELLAAEPGSPSPYQVTVRDGVVDLTGPPGPGRSPAGHAAGPWRARRPRGPVGRGVTAMTTYPGQGGG